MQLGAWELPPHNKVPPHLLAVEPWPQMVCDVNMWTGFPVVVSSVEFFNLKENEVPLLNRVLQLLRDEHVTDLVLPLSVRLEQSAESLLTLLGPYCRCVTIQNIPVFIPSHQGVRDIVNPPHHVVQVCGALLARKNEVDKLLLSDGRGLAKTL